MVPSLPCTAYGIKCAEQPNPPLVKYGFPNIFHYMWNSTTTGISLVENVSWAAHLSALLQPQAAALALCWSVRNFTLLKKKKTCPNLLWNYLQSDEDSAILFFLFSNRKWHILIHTSPSPPSKLLTSWGWAAKLTGHEYHGICCVNGCWLLLLHRTKHTNTYAVVLPLAHDELSDNHNSFL